MQKLHVWMLRIVAAAVSAWAIYLLSHGALSQGLQAAGLAALFGVLGELNAWMLRRRRAEFVAAQAEYDQALRKAGDL